jgi:ATP-dependent RNA helicase DeaD
VAATIGDWALPERATVLTTTPGDALVWMHGGRLALEGVEAVVVDGAASIQAAGDLEAVETILEALSPDAQRLLVALPLTDELESVARRHLKRSVHLPPRAVEEEKSAVPSRGSVRVLVSEGRREPAVAGLVAELLADGAHHVMLFVRNDDVAADLGDQMALRGFMGGAAGEGDVPLWLSAGDLEGRGAMDAADTEIVPVSVDVPTDPDALDRRHGGGRGGVILAEPRELPHLRDIARRTGYRLEQSAPKVAEAGGSQLAAVLASMHEALRAEAVDLDAYQVVLEPLFREHGSARVAAAALGLLRARPPLATSAAGAAEPVQGESARTPRPNLPATVKLFVSLGERDGLRAGDLVGAITGEAGIQGSQVGRIDLRDTFSVVEVDAEVAERVIRALNGTTVKGRSVRVDLDRTERERGATGGGGPGGRGGRPGRGSAGGASGGGSRGSGGTGSRGGGGRGGSSGGTGSGGGSRGRGSGGGDRG